MVSSLLPKNNQSNVLFNSFQKKKLYLFWVVFSSLLFYEGRWFYLSGDELPDDPDTQP